MKNTISFFSIIFVLFVCFSFTVGVACAQTNFKHTKEELEALQQMLLKYENQIPEQGLNYAIEALENLSKYPEDIVNHPIRPDGNPKYRSSREEVINCYTKALESCVNSFGYVDEDTYRGFCSFIYYLRGLAYIEIKKYSMAVNDLSSAIELDGYFIRDSLSIILFVRGEVYLDIGKHAKAIEDFNSLLEVLKKEGNRFNIPLILIYFYLGSLHALIGDIGNALKNYNAALELNCDPIADWCSQVYFNRGVVYKMLGKDVEAVKDFNSALILADMWVRHKGGSLIHFHRGEVYHKNGYTNRRYIDRAIIDYEYALELSDDWIENLQNRLSVLEKLTSVLKNKLDVQEKISGKDYFYLTEFNYKKSLVVKGIKSKEYYYQSESLVCSNEAFKHNDDWVDRYNFLMHYMRGMIYVELGNYDKAKEEINAILNSTNERRSGYDELQYLRELEAELVKRVSDIDMSYVD